MGFKKCIIPYRNGEGLSEMGGVTIIPVKTIHEALKACGIK